MELIIKQNKEEFEIRGDYIIAIKFFYSTGKYLSLGKITEDLKIQIFPNRYIINGKEYKEEPELIREFVAENFKFLLKDLKN